MFVLQEHLNIRRQKKKRIENVPCESSELQSLGLAGEGGARKDWSRILEAGLGRIWGPGSVVCQGCPVEELSCQACPHPQLSNVSRNWKTVGKASYFTRSRALSESSQHYLCVIRKTAGSTWFCGAGPQQEWTVIRQPDHFGPCSCTKGIMGLLWNWVSGSSSKPSLAHGRCSYYARRMG